MIAAVFDDGDLGQWLVVVLYTVQYEMRTSEQTLGPFAKASVRRLPRLSGRNERMNHVLQYPSRLR